MPTVYLDSHGSELVLKVARNTCSEVLKYIANYTGVWVQSKLILYCTDLCKIHSLFLGSFISTPSLCLIPLKFHLYFILVSGISMKWLLGLRCVCVNVCDRFSFWVTKTNLFLIPFPLQAHFHSSTLYSSDTIKYFSFVKQ